MGTNVKSKDPTRSGYGWRTEELWRSISMLYRRGYNDKEIAEQAGCCDRTVLRWRKERGLRSNHFLDLPTR